MPPKKGPRNSMPARINHVNNTTLTPSRRSPRVPAPSKSPGGGTQSSKPSSATPSDSSFNIRFYNPKPPPKSPLSNARSRNASPDAPLNRRRTFQARPSRLSTVYTPSVETPKTPNSNQSARRTRRTAALETPQNEPSDHDFPELLGETGWTFDQYLGTLNYEKMGQKPSTSSSSTEARTSSRLRKPTARAVEASESKQKPRKSKTTTPVPTKETSSKPAASGPKEIVKQAKKSAKDKKNAKKTVLKKLEVDEDKVGQKLYEVALFALGANFVPPTDIQKFISDARDAYNKREADALPGVNGDSEAQAPSTAPAQEAESGNKPTKEASQIRLILKLKKEAPPRIDVDGWTSAGRVNDSGEEVILTPPDHSPYRSPHTYGDDGLPYPPVRARSDHQAENDNSLGFPPLIGDRNIPFDGQSQFRTEDVTEEKARFRARGQKRRQEAPTNKTPAKKPRRKRRQPQEETPVAPVSSAPSAVTTEPAKPPVQRLKLKLKPAPEAQQQPPPIAETATEQANARNSVRSKARGSGRGSIRGSDRGSDRGKGRGAARGADRGSRGAATRGGARGGERGASRGAAQAGDRGGSRGTRGAGGAARGAERGEGERGSRASSRGSVRGATRASRGGITKTRGRGRGRARGSGS